MIKNITLRIKNIFKNIKNRLRKLEHKFQKLIFKIIFVNNASFLSSYCHLTGVAAAMRKKIHP